MSGAEAARIRAAVVDLTLGDVARVEAACARLDARPSEDWRTVISLAAAWGVLPSARAKIDVARRAPEVRTLLAQTALALTMRTAYILHRGAAAVQLLAAAGVPYAVIKGVGMIAVLARSPQRRSTGDCDVIVRPEDAERARSVLMSAGFVEINPDFDLHMDEIAQSAHLHNYARALRLNELEIDLHWRMGAHPPYALAAERLIERAQTTTLAGHSIAAVDPVDGMLISAHHALRGSFGLHNTVRDCCDCGDWWTAGVAERLGELFDLAERSELAQALLALLAMVGAYDPGHPALAGAEQLAARLPRSAVRESVLLRRCFEEQLRFGSPAQLTLELLAPRLLLRQCLGGVRRAFTRRPLAESRPAGAYVRTRRPFAVRLRDLVPRAFRVMREIARLRGLSAYRAVTRAQRRLH